jgi:aspartyl/asparaginyl-tRNA synthetase
MEMAFESHYEEVMYLIDGMFKHIFRNLQQNHRDEVSATTQKYGAHPDLSSRRSRP